MDALETHLKSLEGHKKGAKYAARFVNYNIPLIVNIIKTITGTLMISILGDILNVMCYINSRFTYLLTHLQGGPKKRIPSFIFGITSVIQHRF